MQQKTRNLSEALLRWYDQTRRAFPWRAPQDADPVAYHVWLSEIMLQQTGTASVIPYFEKFIARWPSVDELAAADLDAVLTEWAGLGYYARARNLHKCSKLISTEMNGEFPSDYNELLKLPGIGPYTAAAIAAIAFNRPAAVLDGNIERVVARLYAIETPLPAAKPELRKLSACLIDCQRPGDMAQAMMDLGAGICAPRAPDCAKCPWQDNCLAHARGIAKTLPVKQQKSASPLKTGAVFWLVRKDGAVLLRRRPETGLLGGMMEFPGTPWSDVAYDAESYAASYAPARCRWSALPGVVRHVFTHFKLELKVYAGHSNSVRSRDGIWLRPEELQKYALPTLMQKVAAHAQSAKNEIAA